VSLDRSRSARWFPLAVAALSLMGLVYGVSAAVGEISYFHSRYGVGRRDLTRALALSERAAAFYPFDYYVSIWAGKQAFHGRHQAAAAAESEALVGAAARWAKRGYRLNPYNSETVQLWADVLALKSPRAALDVWAPYVERHFWEPFNHVFLVDLYLRAGDLEKAEEALYWAKPSDQFEGLRKRLEAAQRARMRDG
jgi:hypothetical protein